MRFVEASALLLGLLAKIQCLEASDGTLLLKLGESTNQQKKTSVPQPWFFKSATHLYSNQIIKVKKNTISSHIMFVKFIIQCYVGYPTITS